MYRSSHESYGRKPPSCLGFAWLWWYYESLVKDLFLQTKFPSWWFQPLWKMLVKLDHFPKEGWKSKNVWNHQLVSFTNSVSLEIPFETEGWYSSRHCRAVPFICAPISLATPTPCYWARRWRPTSKELVLLQLSLAPWWRKMLIIGCLLGGWASQWMVMWLIGPWWS